MKGHSVFFSGLSGFMIVALAALLLLSPAGATAGPPNAEDNAALAAKYFDDVMSKGDRGVAYSILAPEFQRIDRSQPAVPLGRAGTLFLADYLRHGFSDASFTIDAIVVQGDNVAVCWTAHGTNDGSYGLMAASNRPMTWTGMSFLAVKDGKILQEMTNLENVSALLGDNGQLRLSPSYTQ